jgi:hypothetical protein
LVGTNFNDIVKDPHHDVLVAFHAPCMLLFHCFVLTSLSLFFFFLSLRVPLFSKFGANVGGAG